MSLDLKLNDVVSFLKKDILSLNDKVVKIHDDAVNKKAIGSDFLGWFNPIDAISSADIDKIYELKAKYDKIDCLVVIGIGGSYLGSKAALSFLDEDFSNKLPKVLYAGFNLSSNYHAQLLKYLKDKDFIVNVISKSGTTLEPAVAFRLVLELLDEKYGKDEAKKRVIVTTDPKSGVLLQIAKKNDYLTFSIPSDIGGRYSLFSNVGLLPIAFGGFDIKKILAGANQAFLDLANPNLDKNDAYKYGVLRYLLYKQNFSTELLINYEPRLIQLAEWWKQLFAESEGKEHKGLFVSSASFTTDLHSLGQYIQDGVRNIFATSVVVKNNEKLKIPFDPDNQDGLNYIAGKNLAEINEMAMKGTIMAHVSGGVPNIVIEIEKLDEFSFGYLTYFFMRACLMSAYLLEVNPFDQPGVEEYKKNMNKLMDKK